MGEDGAAKSRQRGLQQAASVIFALVAVVPLLIFAWTLHSLGAIRSTQAQLSLGLALAVSLLGFWMFRSLLGRMAEVVQALAAAVEQASRIRRPPAPVPVASAPPAPAPIAVGANGEASAAAGDAPPVRTGAAPVFPAPAAPAAAPRPSTASFLRPVPPAPKAAAHGVAGIGKIRELTEVAATMDALWLREATAHLGQRVQIAVANSREPLVGVLSEASGDGLILEQPDGPVPVAYGRVTSIERLTG